MKKVTDSKTGLKYKSVFGEGCVDCAFYPRKMKYMCYKQGDCQPFRIYKLVDTSKRKMFGRLFFILSLICCVMFLLSLCIMYWFPEAIYTLIGGFIGAIAFMYLSSKIL